MTNKLVIGILAHVDAGKTTLSEGLLYLSGKIRRIGRVDNRDAYLDTFELERERGITIFSKQAVFELDNTEITLLDTPGHVDFSTEMERTLGVLDYAILVVSGADGIQGHTKTLWKLLEIYQIPVFLFVNKMDQNGTDKEKLMQVIKNQLSDNCIEFGQTAPNSFYEQVAMCDEHMFEYYLRDGSIPEELVKLAISERKLFPCFFGSALKLQGIDTLLEGISKYTSIPQYSDEFGARIFKISRDEQGNRLTHIKLTGGRLKTRDSLTNGSWEEKVNQIRVYSGQKFEAVNEVEAGTVCAVTGLSQTRPGQGLGIEAASAAPVLEPVFSYQIILPTGYDPRLMLPKLRQIEEEDPELHIVWNEELQEIQVQIMGEVQMEILRSVVQSRFGVEISFGTGAILYKETISNTVEGVGHFEPLRHYAEVHLLLEPGERGSGLEFSDDCSEDILGKSWKSLIFGHLSEKEHRGVLTGSPITDIKITLVGGRAHNKHTQGGDFREATYRAVRQGLKQAKCVLLEPYYSFTLELPEKMVGRAMLDIEKMSGTCQLSQVNEETALITGSAPAVTMQNYQREVTAYTKGMGRLFCTFKGYEPCHNTQEIVERMGYDSERDLANPTASVFCANGSGFIVQWDEVNKYMHVESCLKKVSAPISDDNSQHVYRQQKWMEQDEVDRILTQAYYANQGKRNVWKPQKSIDRKYKESTYIGTKRENKEEYLLVDGYNVLFAWPELSELAQHNMESARIKLLEYISKYQSVKKNKIIVVFDAYRVERHREEVLDYDQLHLVYTKEAQTADQYIERFAHSNQKNYNITVATSDGLQQIILRGAGCSLLSAREFKEVVEATNERVMRTYRDVKKETRNYLQDSLSEDTVHQIKELFEMED